jgi:hypothetical protein
MAINNYISDTIRYLRNILNNARDWQYININGEKTKPRIISLPTLFSAILVSVYLTFKDDSVIMTDNFTAYMLGCFSLFVGLFTTILIMAFDKFTNLYDLYKKDEDDNSQFDFKTSDDRVKYYQSKNYFNQFTHLTLYNIFIAIVLVVFLILVLLFPGLTKPLSFYFDCTAPISKMEFFKGVLNTLHKFIFLTLLLKFFLLSAFSISSIFTYMKINFERKNP